MEEIGLVRRELALVRAEKREIQIERDMRKELGEPNPAAAARRPRKPCRNPTRPS